MIPFVMWTLRTAGMGECIFGALHPEDEGVTEFRLWYAGFRVIQRDISLCMTVQGSWSRFRSGALAELVSENVLRLVSLSLFIWGGVTYPPRDEVLMSFQVPTRDWETDRHKIIQCTNNSAIQKFRSLANWIFHGVYDFVSGVMRQAGAGLDE